MTLRTLNYGNYGIFLMMGNAGFCPSAVFLTSSQELAAAQGLQSKVGVSRAGDGGRKGYGVSEML